MNTSPKPPGSRSPSRLVFACLGFAGVIAVLCCLLPVAGAVWFSNLPDCSVKLGYELLPGTLETLEERGLVDDDETVLAYYDDTVSCDASESAILTDRRLIHHVAPATASLPLSEITDIQYLPGTALGDTIVVTGSDGQTIRIEIAIWNGGATFHTALLNAWHQATE